MACRKFSQLAALVFALTGMAARASAELAEAVVDPAVEAAVIQTPLETSAGYLTEVTPVSHTVANSMGGNDCQRWYIGLGGGWQEREMVHEVGDPTTFIGFDSGFAVNAQVGYRFDVFRVETEFSFMNNDCVTAGSGGLSSRTDGNVNIKAFMFNVYHDFSLFDWLWQPYVGAGIGIYQSELNGLYPDFFDAIPPEFGFQGRPINATSDFPLAYQFRGGMERPVGRRTVAYVGYRFFKGEELEFASAPFASPAAHTFHPDGAAIHSLEWGIRVGF